VLYLPPGQHHTAHGASALRLGFTIPSMRQPFLIAAAASFLLVARVILAQAPDAPAQAPAGPDAVATNLVTTTCSSCHTLDRVRNKVADSDGWTTTVTSMRERGADLTDEQVPLVVEYLARAAATLPVAVAEGGRGGRGDGGGRGDAAGRFGGGGRGRGGGRGGPVAPFSAGGAAVVSARNLKVLTAENVEFTMQNMTFALGLRCIDCHEMNDLALDTKPLKAKALEMLEMARDINARFGDGQTHVTCWTCHRGSTLPEIARPASR